MKCEFIEDLLSDYIENRVDDKLRFEMQSHFKQCSSCKSLLNSVRKLISDSSHLHKEVPFHIKNRLFYIPEYVALDREPPNKLSNLQLIAAMLATAILLLGVFYKTNIYPEGNYFLHKTLSKVERFAVKTKTYVFKNKKSNKSPLLSFIDNSAFNNNKLPLTIDDVDGNG
jgi:predicted anti-sigma-YlaC factor YlaD